MYTSYLHFTCKLFFFGRQSNEGILGLKKVKTNYLELSILSLETSITVHY